MGIRTRLCDLLGIDVPIVQAPIGCVPALAAAVSEAGALGTLPLSWRSDEQIRRAVAETRARTGRPFAANFVLTADRHAAIAAAMREGLRIVSIFWTDPSDIRPYAEQVHAGGGTLVMGVGSADEARRAVEAGADVVVAQGLDAGGHVWGSVGTMSLVPVVVDAVAPVPVLAAGGIADGRGIAAALALGAQGAWLGTRFLVAEEADTHPGYRARVVAATETDTQHSALFDGGWPDAPSRTLVNETWRAWEEAGRPPPGQRPGEGDTVAAGPGGSPVPRYHAASPRQELEGRVEDMAMYAGQGVGLVRRIQPAGEIVRELAAGAEAALRAAGGLASA